MSSHIFEVDKLLQSCIAPFRPVGYLLHGFTREPFRPDTTSRSLSSLQTEA